MLSSGVSTEIIMKDSYQYYPTPLELSELAWDKFKNRHFVRVLEPSAGDGHLLKAWPAKRWNPIPVDCTEIDIAKHDALRKQGFDLVGMDFMQFKCGDSSESRTDSSIDWQIWKGQEEVASRDTVP